MFNDNNQDIGTELLKSAAETVIQNSLGKPTKTIGDILDSCLFLAFGGLKHRADLRRAKYAAALEEFEREIKLETAAIPEEQRIEPNTRTLMTALQDAQFCAEEEEIRQMFARLIASTMNAASSNNVHPSFSGILKTMHPNEAKLLAVIHHNIRVPVSDISIHSDRGELVIFRHICILDPINDNPITQTSIAVDGLSRHGLIRIDQDCRADQEEYQPIEDTPEMKALRKQLHMPPEERLPSLRDATGVVVYGYAAQLTQLGINFCSVCLPARGK